MIPLPPVDGLKIFTARPVPSQDEAGTTLFSLDAGLEDQAVADAPLPSDPPAGAPLASAPDPLIRQVIFLETGLSLAAVPNLGPNSPPPLRQQVAAAGLVPSFAADTTEHSDVQGAPITSVAPLAGPESAGGPNLLPQEGRVPIRSPAALEIHQKPEQSNPPHGSATTLAPTEPHASGERDRNGPERSTAASHPQPELTEKLSAPPSPDAMPQPSEDRAASPNRGASTTVADRTETKVTDHSSSGNRPHVDSLTERKLEAPSPASEIATARDDTLRTGSQPTGHDQTPKPSPISGPATSLSTKTRHIAPRFQYDAAQAPPKLGPADPAPLSQPSIAAASGEQPSQPERGTDSAPQRDKPFRLRPETPLPEAAPTVRRLVTEKHGEDRLLRIETASSGPLPGERPPPLVAADSMAIAIRPHSASRSDDRAEPISDRQSSTLAEGESNGREDFNPDRIIAKHTGPDPRQQGRDSSLALAKAMQAVQDPSSWRDTSAAEKGISEKTHTLDPQAQQPDLSRAANAPISAEKSDPTEVSRLAGSDELLPVERTSPAAKTYPIRAESHTPSPRPASDLTAQFAERVRRDDQGFEIELWPRELGRVTFQLRPTAEGLLVQISTERPETQDLVRRHLDELSRELRSLGHGSVAFGFNGSGKGSAEGWRGRDQGGETAVILADSPEPLDPLPRQNSAGVDIRI